MSRHARPRTWRGARRIVEETAKEGAEGPMSGEDPLMSGGLGDPNAAAREQTKATARAIEQAAKQEAARKAAEAAKNGGN